MADSLLGNAALATEENDDGQLRRTGFRLTADADGSITKARYRVPSNGRPATTCIHYVLIDGSLQRTTDLNAVTPAPSNGAWMEVDITPVDYTEGAVITTYVATLGGKFQFTDPGTFPLESGHLSASTGLYGGGGSPTDVPSQEFAIYWAADLVFDAAATSVDATLQAVSGAGAASLAGAVVDPAVLAVSAPGAAVVAAGSLVNPGVVAMGLGSLNLSLSGSLVNSGTLAESIAAAQVEMTDGVFISTGFLTAGTRPPGRATSTRTNFPRTGGG